MPLNIQFADYCSSTLATAINQTQTAIPVVNASVYPSISTPGYYFYLTLADYATGGNVSREVVKVIAVNLATNVLTVIRGAGGYTPTQFNSGDLADNRVCSQALADLASAGGGAPTGLSYLTAVNETATLTSSRRMASSGRIAVTDGGPGGTFSYDLLAGTITNVYLANANANSILGNNTGSSATPAYLTASQVNAMLGTIIQGPGAGITNFVAGTIAARPSAAAAGAGTVYLATDALYFSISNGTTWSIVQPALNGPVTTSAGNLNTTIGVGQITLSMMAVIPAYTFLGNNVGVGTIPQPLTGADAYGTIFPAFQPSGVGSASGIVPKPPNVAGQLLYLREDATWAGVFGPSGASHSGGLVPDPGGSPGSTRFLREDATWDVPPGGGGGSTFYPNLFRNSGMVVAQRTTQTLSTSPLIGSTDGWAAWVSTGTTTAGTIQQATAAPVGQTGYAFQVAGYTVAGSAVISVRQRIEAKEAIRLMGQTSSIQFNVYQDTGGSVNCTILVNSANAVDNFSSTTNVYTGSPISVSSATPTQVTANGVSFTPACGNGFEVVIQFAVGAQTTKNIYVTEAEVHYGTNAQTYQYVEFDQEYNWCLRYFQKSFPYAVAPATNAGVTGSFNVVQFVAGTVAQNTPTYTFLNPMRVAPSVMLYNPSAANSNIRNLSRSADWSACSASNIGEKGLAFTATGVSGSAVGDLSVVHWTADADTL